MDFFTEYFINPIRFQDQYAPYNVYNTAAYAIIALVAVFLLYKGIRKAGFEIDKRFVHTILPYVVFGGLFRVFEDAKILARGIEVFGMTLYPFVTPLVYVIIFLVLAATAAIAWIATKNREKTLDLARKAGLAYAVVSFLVLVPLFKNYALFIGIALLALAATGAYVFITKKRGLKEDTIMSLMVFGQSFDGAATFVGLQFGGYFEQHVVGNAIIDIGGPIAFFLVKVAFVFLAAEALRGEEKERHRNFVALLITLFGLAPGTRDAFRMLGGI